MIGLQISHHLHVAKVYEENFNFYKKREKKISLVSAISPHKHKKKIKFLIKSNSVRGSENKNQSEKKGKKFPSRKIHQKKKAKKLL